MSFLNRSAIGPRHCIVLAICLAATPMSALASREDVLVSASAGALYDSNRELNSRYSEEIVGGVVRANVGATQTTERGSVALGFRLVEENFRKAKDLENDLKSLSLDGKLLGERSNLGVNVALLSDTTLSFEAQAAGSVRERKDRTKANLSSNYEFDLSETDTLLAGLSAEAVDYSDIIPGQLAEYDYYSGNVGYGKQLFQTSTAQLLAFASRLDNQDAEYYSDTAGVRVVWLETLSDVSNLKASIGWRQTEYRQDLRIPVIQDGRLVFESFEYAVKDQGWLSDIEWHSRGEYWRSQLTVSWNLVPDTGGNLSERYQLTGTGVLRWTALMSTGLTLMAWNQQSELERGSGNDSEGYQAQLYMNWRIERTLSLNARLQRFEREVLNTGERAHSNQVVLELVWTNDPYAIGKF